MADLRWLNAQIASLGLPLASWFAADCITRVLPYYEEKFPSDLRCRDSVAGLGEFLHGRSSLDHLHAAKQEAEAARWGAPTSSRAQIAASSIAVACSFDAQLNSNACALARRLSGDEQQWQAERFWVFKQFTSQEPLRSVLRTTGRADRVTRLLPFIADSLYEVGYAPLTPDPLNDD
ncbi:MAG: hypothetical protein QGG36_08645 [Pirellulaceae bacterium]|jgi:hypothetical protein|nr:hypothetical protein [Pirellulaceae bacterium]MDP7015854.1 hypothetical protein [Pirellulaceae bacterium]